MAKLLFCSFVPSRNPNFFGCPTGSEGASSLPTSTGRLEERHPATGVANAATLTDLARHSPTRRTAPGPGPSRLEVAPLAPPRAGPLEQPRLNVAEQLHVVAERWRSVAKRRRPVAERRRPVVERRRPVADRRRPVAEPQERQRMAAERRRMVTERRRMVAERRRRMVAGRRRPLEEQLPAVEPLPAQHHRLQIPKFKCYHAII